MPRNRGIGVKSSTDYLGECLPGPVQDLIRFGEDFELDVGSGQLIRANQPLKLERIPMEVLLFLVQHRGELVTREQLVEKIWGREVFLDTDNSINTAIRKIRVVLKDDPEQPRFIQTITGKGYRFIAPILSPDAEPDARSATPESPVRNEISGWSQRRWILLLSVFVLAGAIALLAGFGFRFGRPVSQSQISQAGRPMLAVLPFQNLTGDPGQEYFSDGMTEEMIAQLGSMNPDRMGVIARTSVMHYKHSQEPLLQIAHELGVQYVLEGSVRRDADKVRITAQLIQISDQTHLWARQYDRDPRDLLVLQVDIAREISHELQAALGENKAINPIPRPALSPQAYESYIFYLKGQYFWNKRSHEDFLQAISYFQQAIEKDPNDARAYAGLAGSYALVNPYIGAPQAEYAARSRTAALRALQLDDQLPEAHAALALVVQNQDYDWETAEKEFKRAIELNPNYATGHHWYAEHLAWRGRFDEALQESERARQLDPLSLIIASDNAVILYYARQYDRAIAQFKAVRELDPKFPRTGMIFAAYVEKGMFAEAETEIHTRFVIEAPWKSADLAYTYGRAGDRAKAQQYLHQLLDMNRKQQVDPYVMVVGYLGVGDRDHAIAWLDKAYAQHSNGLTALKVDPACDPLRDDPRFQNLLHRVGLAP